ncbi:MAG: tetratricopeptide repeat protein [Elusimicrobia bacterium]|nr:tetratricopeptide repeat protein [Elusimicrobiota bacterium]
MSNGRYSALVPGGSKSLSLLVVALFVAPCLSYAGPTASEYKRQADEAKDNQARIDLTTKAIEAWTEPEGKSLLAWIYQLRANAYHDIAEFEPALADIDKSLELVPGNGYSLDIRGAILSSMGRCDEAIEARTAAIKSEEDDKSRKGPVSWHYYFNRANDRINCLKTPEQGFPDLATAASLARKAKDPRGAYEATAFKARTLCKLKKYQQGLAILRGLVGSKDSPRVQFDLGECYFRWGKGEADGHFTKFIRTQLGAKENIDRMAGSASRVGEETTAGGSILTYDNLNPEIILAFYWRGIARERRKKLLEAAGDFSKAIDASSETPQARWRTEFDLPDCYYRRAGVNARRGDKVWAKDDLREACRLGKKQACRK